MWYAVRQTRAHPTLVEEHKRERERLFWLPDREVVSKEKPKQKQYKSVNCMHIFKATPQSVACSTALTNAWQKHVPITPGRLRAKAHHFKQKCLCEREREKRREFLHARNGLRKAAPCFSSLRRRTEYMRRETCHFVVGYLSLGGRTKAACRSRLRDGSTAAAVKRANVKCQNGGLTFGGRSASFFSPF